MALNDVKQEDKSFVILGGKQYPIRFPVRAFRELQDKYGGWMKAWSKLVNTEEGSTITNDLNYDVLIGMLQIGIYQEGMTEAKISELINDMMQDEIAEIIVAMMKAKNRWGPEPENTPEVAIDHLTKAADLLTKIGREQDGDIVSNIAERIKQETVGLGDDPSAKTV